MRILKSTAKQFSLNYSRLKFVARNVKCVLPMTPLRSLSHNGILYRSMVPGDIKEIRMLMNSLNHGIGFTLDRRLLYRFAGSKLTCIAVAELDRKVFIAGIDLFYFNQRDIMDKTVHEGFIGVVPEFRGRGLASQMRQHAIRHFEMNGIQGVSTRISLDNKGSMKSAEKLGFKIIDRYIDKDWGEERCYMVLRFPESEHNRDPKNY